MQDTPDDGQINRFSLTQGATTAVEKALERAMHRHLDTMADLKVAIEACAAELRAHGLPPEVMLVTMKAFIRHTAASHPPPGNLASSWAADSYIEEIVRWSITEYYRESA